MLKSSTGKPTVYMREYNARPEVIERNRFNKLRRAYGISRTKYEEVFAAQRGVCAICKGSDAKNRKHSSWGVDHSHKTGKIRGILCGPCNLLLGHAQEDAQILRSAADYLEKASAN